ncbi:MAG TPA: KOW domain-containing RNA-binding protein [Firmicutes bacterium]|nr:KOW domain-containing RNA-binding protein [Bacillota bacterium]
MELYRGCVVKIRAGRDADTFMAVADFDNSRVYLVNGKDRCLNKPKSKNYKHITLTKMVLDEETMSADKKIKRKLREIAKEQTPEGGI